MLYQDGQQVLLGDLVDLGAEMTGVVVGLIEENLYATGYSNNDWGVLKVGALVESSEAGIMHFPTPYVDFVLIERQKNS